MFVYFDLSTAVFPLSLDNIRICKLDGSFTTLSKHLPYNFHACPSLPQSICTIYQIIRNKIIVSFLPYYKDRIAHHIFCITV